MLAALSRPSFASTSAATPEIVVYRVYVLAHSCSALITEEDADDQAKMVVRMIRTVLRALGLPMGEAVAAVLKTLLLQVSEGAEQLTVPSELAEAARAELGIVTTLDAHPTSRVRRTIGRQVPSFVSAICASPASGSVHRPQPVRGQAGDTQARARTRRMTGQPVTREAAHAYRRRGPRDAITRRAEPRAQRERGVMVIRHERATVASPAPHAVREG